MHLGCCYYPEHWPEAQWRDDFARMADLGLTRVRMGEFAWSRIEPAPEEWRFDWLDRAMDLAGEHGLGVILGTPTATPPKWLVDADPDVLAWDIKGRPRRFGSRRHYCFSSEGYRAQSRRITAKLAERYGGHPALAMWQTDNEYGCHDTVLSYSPAAARAFRRWLAERYGTVQALNADWGNVFWSMEYRDFAEIDLPNLTVTEANPAHWLAFRRFASDQVASFNAEQVAILRAHSPTVPITHNFMGHFTEFDHHRVGRDLDMATWDSYPLGFLDVGPYPAEAKAVWRRTGHPDFAAFHHDLYRGCSPQWGVMEQQPGPVNWARHNAAPLPGMVRLWSWEAYAHGAALMSYFRWRQAPFAQEQMHAGLCLPDSKDAPAMGEVQGLAEAIGGLGEQAAEQSPVALVFAYEAQWMTQIQPQGGQEDYAREALRIYSALRAKGQDIDIVGPDADLAGYRMVVLPGQMHVSEALVEALAASGALVLIGPRSGSKTDAFGIPAALPPGPLRRLIPIHVTHVESAPGDVRYPLEHEAGTLAGMAWREWVEVEPRAGTEVRMRFADDGAPAWLHAGRAHYLAARLDDATLSTVLDRLLGEAGLSSTPLPRGLRLRRRGDLVFAFNYGPETADLLTIGAPDRSDHYVVGGRILDVARVAAWRRDEA